MTGEILPFAPDDVYISGYNVGYCRNLARIFNVGEQVRLIEILSDLVKFVKRCFITF